MGETGLLKLISTSALMGEGTEKEDSEIDGRRERSRILENTHTHRAKERMNAFLGALRQICCLQG